MIDFFSDPAVWIVIGAIISALASLKATKDQAKETADQARENAIQQQELSKKAADIVKKQDELNQKSAGIINQQEQLSSKQSEMFLLSQAQLKEQTALREKAEINEKLALKLAESQRELASLSAERYNSTIGRDSYCYVELSMPIDPNADDADEMYLYLHHVGKYALKNLEVSIVNTDLEFGQLLDRNASYENEQEDYHNYKNPYHDKMASFTPDDVPTPLKRLRTVRRDQKSFHIRFKTDNKTWYQRVLLRRVGGYELKPHADVPNYDSWFLSEFQVYELNNNGPNKVHRYENILLESIVRDGYDTGSIKGIGYQKIWRRFPLKKGELERLPFGFWPSLYWDGASFDYNYGLYFPKN